MAHELVKFVGSPAQAVNRTPMSGFEEADMRRAVGDKYSTKILSYPLNVDTDPQQGHWIMFEIMQISRAAMFAAKKRGLNAPKALWEVVKSLGATSPDAAIAGTLEMAQGLGAGAADAARVVVEAYKGTHAQQSGINSLTAKMATTKLQTVIALYMPPSVQVSYNSKYAEQEIGVLAETVNAGIKAFMETGGGLMNQFAAAAGTGVGGATSATINAIKGKLMTGGAALASIKSGSIITPRMELMFEGIQRRNFSFNFVFIPKSEKEAQVVEEIVNLFKFHMASNYGSMGLGGVDGVRELEIPDFFNIKYMYQSGRNTHLNKIKQCVLQTATVEYGADRYKSYEGGRPQTTKLNLTFQEQEIITKDYIADGF